jgi:hypothetical protein
MKKKKEHDLDISNFVELYKEMPRLLTNLLENGKLGTKERGICNKFISTKNLFNQMVFTLKDRLLFYDQNLLLKNIQKYKDEEKIYSVRTSTWMTIIEHVITELEKVQLEMKLDYLDDTIEELKNVELRRQIVSFIREELFCRGNDLSDRIIRVSYENFCGKKDFIQPTYFTILFINYFVLSLANSSWQLLSKGDFFPTSHIEREHYLLKLEHFYRKFLDSIALSATAFIRSRISEKHTELSIPFDDHHKYLIMVKGIYSSYLMHICQKHHFNGEDRAQIERFAMSLPFGMQVLFPIINQLYGKQELNELNVLLMPKTSKIPTSDPFRPLMDTFERIQKMQAHAIKHDYSYIKYESLINKRLDNKTLWLEKEKQNIIFLLDQRVLLSSIYLNSDISPFCIFVDKMEFSHSFKFSQHLQIIKKELTERLLQHTSIKVKRYCKQEWQNEVIGSMISYTFKVIDQERLYANFVYTWGPDLGAEQVKNIMLNLIMFFIDSFSCNLAISGRSADEYQEIIASIIPTSDITTFRIVGAKKARTTKYKDFKKIKQLLQEIDLRTLEGPLITTIQEDIDAVIEMRELQEKQA